MQPDAWHSLTWVYKLGMHIHIPPTDGNGEALPPATTAFAFVFPALAFIVAAAVAAAAGDDGNNGPAGVSPGLFSDTISRAIAPSGAGRSLPRFLAQEPSSSAVQSLTLGKRMCKDIEMCTAMRSALGT